MAKKEDLLLQFRLGRRNELESDLNEYIIQRLKAAREDHAYSQRQLSQMLRRSNAYISQVEGGRLDLTAVDLIGLSVLLDKPLKYFVPTKEDSEKLNGEEWNLVDQYRRIEDPAIKEAAIKQVAQLAKVRSKPKGKK